MMTLHIGLWKVSIIGNDVSGHILFYYTNKKGWRFQKDDLSQTVLENYIVKFLFTTTLVIRLLCTSLIDK